MKRLFCNRVFILSVCITASIILWGIFGRDSMTFTVNMLMSFMRNYLSGFYLVIMLSFVIFALVLACGRWGKIRLGRDDEKPEYGLVSWLSMLFGAGMGIGLVFWGVAEPLSHYLSPAEGIAPQSQEAACFAFRSCFMHWTLHPWSCYAVMGLGLAYIQFRKNKPALVSNILRPLLNTAGKHTHLKNTADIYTVVLTAVGVASSFGIGCLQVSSGLKQMFGIPDDVLTWMVLIILISVVYIYTAVTGVSRGVLAVSNLNMILFFAMLILGFLAGSKRQMVGDLFLGVRNYLINFLPDSLRIHYNGDSVWIMKWRVYYWAWWIAWAPFVGIFIARISRGRTIREFILGVIGVPSVLSVLWFTVMGRLAISVSGSFGANELALLTQQPEQVMFRIFRQYSWLGTVMSLVGLVLLVTFFITSANSAVFVLAMSTDGGSINPPNSLKIIWGVLVSALALAMILAGGVATVQSLTIVFAFPYLFLLVLIGISMIKELRKEKT